MPTRLSSLAIRQKVFLNFIRLSFFGLFIIQAPVLLAQNSLSLDYFKRIDALPAGQNLEHFSKTPTGFLFAGAIDTQFIAVTGCNDQSSGQLILTDENLNLKWVKCMGPTGAFYFAQQDNNGSIWAVGYFDTIFNCAWSGSYTSTGVVKLDSSGSTIWCSFYGSTYSNISDFITTSDGGALILEEFNYAGGDIPFKYGNDPFYYNGWLCKLDSSGNITWSIVLGGSGSQASQVVKELTPGTYTVLINTTSTDYMLAGINTDSIDNNPWLLQIDTGGHILSSHVMVQPEDTATSSGFTDFATLTNNAIIIVGHFLPNSTSFCYPGLGDDDFIFLCGDSALHYHWCAVNGGSGYDGLNYVCSINDSTIVAVGSSSSKDGDLSNCSNFSQQFNEHIWIGLYSLNQHQKVWEQCLCGSGSDEVKGILYDSTKNAIYVFLTGTSTDGDFTGIANGNQNAYLLKYTPVVSGIQDVAANAFNFNLSPNPANNYTTITISSAVHNPSLQVLDLTGRLITQAIPTSNTHNLPTTNYPAGLYFIKIVDADGNVGVRKMVKE
jgi:hypothetical protein